MDLGNCYADEQFIIRSKLAPPKLPPFSSFSEALFARLDNEPDRLIFVSLNIRGQMFQVPFLDRRPNRSRVDTLSSESGSLKDRPGHHRFGHCAVRARDRVHEERRPACGV